MLRTLAFQVALCATLCFGSSSLAQVSLTTPSYLLVDSDSPSAVSPTALVQQDATGLLLGAVSFTTPATFGTATGIAVVGGQVYVVGSDALVGRVDLGTSTLVDTFTIPTLDCTQFLEDCVMDMGVIGNDLLIAALGGQIFRYTVAGTLVQSWTLPFQVGGVASNGTQIHVVGFFDGNLRTLDLTGAVQSTISTPLPPFSPWSLDYLQSSGTFLVSQLSMDNIVEVNTSGAIVNTIPWAVGALAGVQRITAPAATENFQRGDTNSDGALNIADAIYLLGNLFPIGAPNVLDCEDAADANDDGSLNIADAVAILGALFGSPAVPLPHPGSSCGADVAPAEPSDALTCATPPCP